MLGAVGVVGCCLTTGGPKNLKENSDLPQTSTHNNFYSAGGGGEADTETLYNLCSI
jgi:hypothetical protein